MASKQAREKLKEKGLKVDTNKFDFFDALEDKNDLTQLFEVLHSVKDKKGLPAVFTAMTLPANPDFDRIIQNGYRSYQYELLYETWEKLPGYEGMKEIWQQGINNRLIYPQFHGREHLNVKVLMEALQSGDKETLACFENRSYSAISTRLYPTINVVAAFDFDHFEENEMLKEIVLDGLNAFEKVFGFRALHFAAPGAREHRCIAESLHKGGILFLDSDMLRTEHQGIGKYKWSIDYTGKKNKFGQIYLVRNVVFEPSPNDGIDWVGYCIQQIDIAFKWNKPAIISTHRVNFAGHIEPSNREKGLNQLGNLLKEIIKRWPEIEFMTTVELGELIRASD